MEGHQQQTATAPISAHFVNNVLAAAASYIEDDPEFARDVLAELGQFMSYCLREDPSPVPISKELVHVATYLRLQQARFPERIDVLLPPDGTVSGRRVTPGSVQRPLAQALSRRLGEHSGRCEVALRTSGEDLEVTVGSPGDADPERVPIALTSMEGALS